MISKVVSCVIGSASVFLFAELFLRVFDLMRQFTFNLTFACAR